MSLIEVRNRIYPINDSDVRVEWGSYDFTDDVAGIPDAYLRTALLETGVMYVPAATPMIRVSHALSVELQGLSALHEELCMNQKTASCPDVEAMVIDSIKDPEQQTDFIRTRLRMFGALCVMDASNEQFTDTHKILALRSGL